MNNNKIRQKKRVAIFVYSLGGGGAEKAALELIQGLKEEFDISILLFSPVVKYTLPSGLNYEVLDKFDFHDNPIKKILKLPFLAYKYAKFCKQNHIDISLSILSRPNIISLLSKFFGNRAKIVLSEHSTLSHYYGSSLSESLMKKLISSIYKLADKIICVSKGSREDLIKNFCVPSEKAVVINNPIDIQKIQAMSLEKLYEKSSGEFSFLTCGRLIKSKNCSMLIEAFAKANIPNSRLLILGEGEERGSLELLSSELGVAQKIDFVGFSDNPYAYMSRSDLFVFTSNLEALPTVLIEALSCALPVLSTDCPSGPEEILCGEDIGFENGIKMAKYGILTQMNDTDSFAKAMRLMYNDQKLRESYAASALVRASEFAKDAMNKKYRETLD